MKGFGQNQISATDSSFINLKHALTVRANIATNFTIILSQSSRKQSNEIKSILGRSNELKQYISEISVVDSGSLTLLYLKNVKLTEALKKAIIKTETDQKLKKNKYLFNIILQLEGSENRIFIERKLYNDKHIEINRLDLLFGTDQPLK